MEVKTISEQLLFTTVQIVTYKNISDTHPSGTGTGFLFAYQVSEGSVPFIVTNKHVIAKAKKGAMAFSQGKDGNVLLGTSYTILIENFEDQFFGHPDKDIDVAIIPFVPFTEAAKQQGVELYTRNIPYNLIPVDETLHDLDAIEDILFIGYPNGLWDTKNLLPIVRRGITATPINIDFEGKKQFLIDASVFPGSSGSPVFLYNRGIYYSKSSNSTVVGQRLFFLGVVASVYQKLETGEIKILSTPTVDIPIAITPQAIDIGVVYKASTIMETIKAFLDKRGISHNISIA